jgi:hypothetical protein
MMRGSAGFNAHQAGFEACEELKNKAALQLSADDDRAGCGNGVHLEYLFSKVESNRGNLFHGWFLPCGS